MTCSGVMILPPNKKPNRHRVRLSFGCGKVACPLGCANSGATGPVLTTLAIRACHAGLPPSTEVHFMDVLCWHNDFLEPETEHELKTRLDRCDGNSIDVMRRTASVRPSS